MCGPWTFLKLDSEDGAECGPAIVGTVTTSNSQVVTQFGGGWAIGLGTPGSDGKKPFGLAIGVLVDPSDKIIDYNVIDRRTLLVNPQYAAGVQNGSISAMVSRPTLSTFIMVSKTF